SPSGATSSSYRAAAVPVCPLNGFHGVRLITPNGGVVDMLPVPGDADERSDMRIRRAALAIFIAASVAAATGCTAGTTGHVEDVSLAADSSSAPLEILLTDDDGWDAPGIQAVYEALTDNGYDVTMVAPAENHSGASAGFDFTGEVTVKTHHDDPDMY